MDIYDFSRRSKILLIGFESTFRSLSQVDLLTDAVSVRAAALRPAGAGAFPSAQPVSCRGENVHVEDALDVSNNAARSVDAAGRALIETELHRAARSLAAGGGIAELLRARQVERSPPTRASFTSGAPAARSGARRAEKGMGVEQGTGAAV